MLYFIPAWYQLNSFKELEQNWHTRRMHTEFDDTVKHVQMFYRNGIKDFKILLLSHTPNFRHFLHRQGVFHAPYLSVFDSIQEVRGKKAAVFSFHNLAWPDEIEFVYTPFVVIAYLAGKKYAQINYRNLIARTFICFRCLYLSGSLKVSVFRQCHKISGQDRHMCRKRIRIPGLINTYI